MAVSVRARARLLLYCCCLSSTSCLAASLSSYHAHSLCACVCVCVCMCMSAFFSYFILHIFIFNSIIYTIHIIMFWDRGKSLVPTDLLDDGSRRLVATARRVFIACLLGRLTKCVCVCCLLVAHWLCIHFFLFL